MYNSPKGRNSKINLRLHQLVAPVRCGDFVLTSIQESPDVSPSWTIIDSRHGYVLLMNHDGGSLTVFNPLLWWSKTFGLCKEENIHHVKHTRAQCIYSDEEPMSFRVVLLCHDSTRVRATVFSSKTMEWSILPWMEVPERRANGPKWLVLISGSMQANRFMYWVCTNNGIPVQDPPFMIAVDKTTMEISFAEVPLCLDDEHCSFHIGEMKDTSPCIVYASDDLNIGVLLRATEGGCAQSWYLQKVSNMYTHLTKLLGDNPLIEVDVAAVMDGFAYLAVDMGNGTPNSRLILSLCLETMELDKLCQVAFHGGVYPYIMAWPPVLVGNYGAFELGDAQ
ncbi:hypothetical protein BRADI_4g07365v3 [Brachypodium distachyon]|uniref:F-box protein AT5G49610-like beta-propeller domain-containing protein n=1 Tax=Brachypodium distachyon TaxID=15368 RepID=A0A0Q3PC50_BRADI|nr:hypothetical protein BRADI_4g07365v3 [Brachypodium distachyon]